MACHIECIGCMISGGYESVYRLSLIRLDKKQVYHIFLALAMSSASMSNQYG